MGTQEQNKNIDFGKVVSSDDINAVADVIKGVSYLLSAMEIMESECICEDTTKGLQALQIALDYGIKEIETLKPNIEYMDDFMRYETINSIE